jgi:hypothetical protein
VATVPAATHAQDPTGTEAIPAATGELRVRVDAKRLHVRAGRRARVSGRIAPAVRGVPVKLQVRSGGRWATLDRTTSAANGAFRLQRRLRSARSAPARIVTGSSGAFRAGTERLGRLNVYRAAHASWYGPGLYGGHLACGGTLTAGTLGVANKSLPCGARVTLRHGGRSVRVPVVDRGPYVGGREYDLTSATAQKLRFRGHGALLVTR